MVYSKRSDKFQKSVIYTTREGKNVAGLYFAKENVLKVIESLVCNQRVEETRNLDCAGRYGFSTAYKKFFVD